MTDIKKITVDAHLCAASGICVRLAPQLFTLADDANAADVLVPEVDDPELTAAADEAEGACPTGAIAVG